MRRSVTVKPEDAAKVLKGDGALLTLGADPEAVDPSGLTPLLLAGVHRRPGSARVLLEYGAEHTDSGTQHTSRDPGTLYATGTHHALQHTSDSKDTARICARNTAE